MKFQGFWANIVDYTVAYISFKTAQRIDLNQIWMSQAISTTLRKDAEIISKYVYDYIVKSANGQNPTQWCKKEACWKGLKNKSIPISQELNNELIEIGKKTLVSVVQNIESASEEERRLIKYIKKLNQIHGLVFLDGQKKHQI